MNDNKEKVSRETLKHEYDCCMELICAALAKGAIAGYILESHEVGMQHGEWGPFKVSAESITDVVDSLGPESGWEFIRYATTPIDTDVRLVMSRDELDRWKEKDRA